MEPGSPQKGESHRESSIQDERNGACNFGIVIATLKSLSVMRDFLFVRTNLELNHPERTCEVVIFFSPTAIRLPGFRRIYAFHMLPGRKLQRYRGICGGNIMRSLRGLLYPIATVLCWRGRIHTPVSWFKQPLIKARANANELYMVSTAAFPCQCYFLLSRV